MALFGEEMRADGILTGLDWKVYEDTHQLLGPLMGTERTSPAAVVYLRCPPEVCAVRTQARARAGEVAITLEYLAKLHTRHEDYIAQVRARGVPVLTLDGMTGVDAMGDHVERIVKLCL